MRQDRLRTRSTYGSRSRPTGRRSLAIDMLAAGLSLCQSPGLKTTSSATAPMPAMPSSAQPLISYIGHLMYDSDGRGQGLNRGKVLLEGRRLRSLFFGKPPRRMI